MKKQNIVTTYVVYLDGYYEGPIKARRIAKLLGLIGTNGIVCNMGYDMIIITAANNVLNATEIANTLIACFDEHYMLKKLGEVSC